MKCKVLNHFDVWGNEEEGFQVNDSMWCGDIEITEDEMIIETLKKRGYLTELANDENVEIDYNNFDTIEVNERETGRPLFTLFIIDEGRK